METIVVIWLVVLTFFGVVDHQQIGQLNEKVKDQSKIVQKNAQQDKLISQQGKELVEYRGNEAVNAKLITILDANVKELASITYVTVPIDRRTGQVYGNTAPQMPQVERKGEASMPTVRGNQKGTLIIQNDSNKSKIVKSSRARGK